MLMVQFAKGFSITKKRKIKDIFMREWLSGLSVTLRVKRTPVQTILSIRVGFGNQQPYDVPNDLRIELDMT